MLKAYGIDLGTTTSILAEVENEPTNERLPVARPVQIEQKTGAGIDCSYIVPSIVVAHGGQAQGGCEGYLWVGKGAQELKADAGNRNVVRYKDLFFDCKNDIGTSVRYEEARNQLISPVVVASKILAFIKDQGIENVVGSSIVVTVPASFQMQQRKDTEEACRLAGLNIACLLDEPTAAFIDYLSQNKNLEDELKTATTLKKIIVIDFGGGTCDIALFELTASNDKSVIARSLGVSRYFRLGGGDIDLALVHKHIIPALRKENNLSDFDLSFGELDKTIIPQLLPIAESIKMQISNRLHMRKVLPTEEFRYPGGAKIGLFGKSLTLSSDATKISFSSFLDILQPFIDSDAPENSRQDNEYFSEESIFSPIKNTLSRSKIGNTDIDYVLTVGGSSRLPPVDDAIRAFFKEATHLRYPRQEDFQLSVSRGAAIQAWYLMKHGKDVIPPVAQDDILLNVYDKNKGETYVALIRASSPLPFSGNIELTVPQDAFAVEGKVAIKFFTGQNQQIGGGTLNITGAKKGQKIILDFEYNKSQTFSASARLKEITEGAKVDISIENPLVNVINPNAKVQEREFCLVELSNYPSRWNTLLVDAAKLSAELNQLGRALDFLERYQDKHVDKHSKRDPHILNLQSRYELRRKNYNGAREFILEAIELRSEYTTYKYNLAYIYYAEGLYENALDTLKDFYTREKHPAYRVLELEICGTIIRKTAIKVGNDTFLFKEKMRIRREEKENIKKQAQEILMDFLQVEKELDRLNDFKIGKLLKVAQIAGNREVERQVNEFQKTRKNHEKDEGEIEGVLPMI